MSSISRKRQLAIRACELLRADRWWSRFDNLPGLLTLNYHRFGDPERSVIDPGVFSATAEQFEAEISYLAKNCDLIRLEDIPDVMRIGGTRRAVLLTIDDGYLDNYEIAYPILKQYNASAVIFLATGFLDAPRVSWWDEVSWIVRQARGREIRLPTRWNVEPLTVPVQNWSHVASRILRIVKTLTAVELHELLEDLAERTRVGRAPVTPDTAPWMTWEMIREMRRGGIEFGGHTVTHPVLSYCPIDQQRAEITESKARIEQELGERITAFSYPVGMQTSFTDQTMRLVQEAGYHWAFGFYSGYSGIASNPFDLRRIAVHPEIGDAEFRMMVNIPRLFGR